MKVTQEAVDLYASPPDGLKLPGRHVSRNAEIIRRRAQGDSLRVIGKDYGLSKQQVSCICRRAMRLVAECSDGIPLTHGLSFRSRRALAYSGITEPKALCGLTVEELSRTPNIGKRSISEITAWAERNGVRLTSEGKQETFAPH